MRNNVIVIVGSGGIGATIARRLGSGRTIVLSDVNSHALEVTANALAANGHEVHARTVDVTSPSSVTDLAAYAATLRPITNLVHTAGVSPEPPDVNTILHVACSVWLWCLSSSVRSSRPADLVWLSPAWRAIFIR